MLPGVSIHFTNKTQAIYPPLHFHFAMSSVSTNNSYLDLLNSTNSSTTNTDRMNDLTMTDFIKMMVAELENQDPMDPMSNTEMLSQINQMRSITSSDKLSASIESLTLGQSLSTASSLIGQTVTGINSLGKEVTGKVDKVKIEDGVAKLYIGSSIVEVSNVTAINDTDTKSPDPSTENESSESGAEET